MKKNARLFVAILLTLFALTLLGTVVLAEGPIKPRSAEAAFVGEVEARPETAEGVWVIAGRDVIVTERTRLIPSADEIQVGDTVVVEGKSRADGFYARSIVKAGSPPDRPRVVRGKITAIGDTQWTIGETVVLIDENTRITGDPPDVGDLAAARVVETDAGLLAKAILVKDWRPGEREVALRGVVRSIENEVWMVESAGEMVTVIVGEETRIIGDPVVGDEVGVKGHVLDDGSVRARVIVKLGGREERVAFAGFVTEILPTPAVLPPTWVWRIERPAFGDHEAESWLVMVTEQTRTNIPPNEVEVGRWVKGWGLSPSADGEPILAAVALVTPPPQVRFFGEVLAVPESSDYPLGVWQIGDYAVHVSEDTHIIGDPPQVGDQAAGFGTLRMDGGVDARLLRGR